MAMMTYRREENIERCTDSAEGRGMMFVERMRVRMKLSRLSRMSVSVLAMILGADSIHGTIY